MAAREERQQGGGGGGEAEQLPRPEELLLQRLTSLGRKSSVQPIAAIKGDPFNLVAYSDVHQRLYFFGVEGNFKHLHYIKLTDLSEPVASLRLGGVGDDGAPTDRFDETTRVTNTSFNSSGERLLLWGSRYVGAVHVTREGELRGDAKGRAVPHRLILNSDVDARTVLKAAWHPLSRTHVVVLLGDKRGGPTELLLYDVTSASGEPEFGYPLGGDVTSFCFGPESLWQRFAVYLVGTRGGLYVLCPVIPHRCRVSAWAVLQLRQGVAQLMASARQRGAPQRHLQHYEAQLELLDRGFGNVTSLAQGKDRPDYLKYRWVQNRLSMSRQMELQLLPDFQELSWSQEDSREPPETGATHISLLNPSDPFPVFAITYRQQDIDVVVVPSTVHPRLLRHSDEPPRDMEMTRLARLQVGHGQNEAAPRVLLDPERNHSGVFYVVGDRSVVRAKVPAIKDIADVNSGNVQRGAAGRTRPRGGAQGPFWEAPSLEEMLPLSENDTAAGATTIYNAVLGSHLLVRRRLGHVHVLNLTVVSYFDASLRPPEPTLHGQLDSWVPGFVSFEESIRETRDTLERNWQAMQGSLKFQEGDLTDKKEAVIRSIIIPLRSLQLRMICRSDDLKKLYAKALTRCGDLHDQLKDSREEHQRLKDMMEEADKAWQKDYYLASCNHQIMTLMRSIITAKERQEKEDLEAADERLASLAARLQDIRTKAEAELGQSGDAQGSSQQRLAEHSKSLVQDIQKDTSATQDLLAFIRALQNRRAGEQLDSMLYMEGEDGLPAIGALTLDARRRSSGGRSSGRYGLDDEDE